MTNKEWNLIAVAHSPLADLLLSVAVIMIMLFSTSGCNQNPVGKPDETAQAADPWIMPADLAQLNRLMAAPNMAGRNLVVSDGHAIYLPGNADNLIRSTPRGDETVILSDMPAGWLQLLDETLYYLAGAEQGVLHKIGTDGANAVRIGQENLTQLISGDDELYAINSTDRPVRISLDGTTQIVLVDKPVNCMIRQDEKLILTGQRVEDGIMFYDLVTGSCSTVLQAMAVNLQITDNRLYYTDPQKNNQIYSISLKEAEAYFSKAIEQSAGVSAATDLIQNTDIQEMTNSPVTSHSDYA